MGKSDSAKAGEMIDRVVEGEDPKEVIGIGVTPVSWTV